MFDSTRDATIARTLFRRSLVVAIPVATVVGLTFAAYAAVQTFQRGEPLSATKMNGNFAELEARIKAVEQQGKPVVSVGTKRYSIGATYCGYTAPTRARFPGPFPTVPGGYAGGKTLCEAVASCGTAPMSGASAHMCTAEELARSAQLGMLEGQTFGPHLVFAGSFYQYGWMTSAGTGDDECNGWTRDVADSRRGPTWHVANAGTGVMYPSTAQCSEQVPILCCN